MHYLIVLYSLSICFTTCISITSSLFPRDDPTPTPPIINATITDHNGVDITSAFQIRLYHEPFKPNVTNTNASIPDRRTTLARPINDCQVPSSLFRSSHCTREDGKVAGMQSWEIACLLPASHRDPKTRARVTSMSTTRRSGYCGDDEICVDTMGYDYRGRPAHMASCVSEEDFVFVHDQMSVASDDGVELAMAGMAGMTLAEMKAGVVVSREDGKTPVEVDTFDLEAGGKGGELDQSKKCRDCMELKSDAFALGTESLKAEATLLTAGAATGILWLAIVSG